MKLPGREIVGFERDALVIDILENISSFSRTDSGVERWDNGWMENLEELKKTRNPESLNPKYIKPSRVMRYDGKFFEPYDENFEMNWYKEFTKEFFQEWICGFKNIFEFGCGSGINLVALKKMFPNSRVCGLDWSGPSVEIANIVAEGRKFNFFNPDYTLDIPDSSVVLTIGALEQVDDAWRDFLDFLFKKKPARICHIEPIYEWYDSNNLVDYTAMKAHQARGFWSGYWPEIKMLEEKGFIRLLHKERTGIGSRIIEGYSQLVWELV